MSHREKKARRRRSPAQIAAARKGAEAANHQRALARRGAWWPIVTAGLEAKAAGLRQSAARFERLPSGPPIAAKLRLAATKIDDAVELVRRAKS